MAFRFRWLRWFAGPLSRAKVFRLDSSRPDGPALTVSAVSSPPGRLQTKSDLRAYLEDPMVRVVALKGRWGTGKTFLWDEIKDEIDARAEKPHLYASLFAASSVEEAKRRLLNSALRDEGAQAEKLRAAAGTAGQVGVGLLKRLVPAGDHMAELITALGGIAQSSIVEAMLTGRLIVLDDIERRSSTFALDEVMGLVDGLKRSGCNVLLIFNEEAVAEHAQREWAVLKEKCLDREVTLLTLPKEAAELGLSQDLAHRDWVVEALFRASVTNIRVVQRVDRVIDVVFGDREAVESTVVSDLVPAAAILTAVYFDPQLLSATLDQVRGAWHRSDANGNGEEGTSEQAALRAAISRLRVTRDLEFIDLLHRHLTTGARLSPEFEELLRQRNQRARASQADSSARRYLDAAALNPQMRDEDFVELAKLNLSAWSTVPPDIVDGIVSDLAARGAQALAEELASRWADAWQATPRKWGSNLYSAARFHLKIRDAITRVNEALHEPKSLYEAVLRASSDGWGNDDTEAINGATDAELDRTLRELDFSTFPIFINFYASELGRRGEGMFAAGVLRFMAAVQRVLFNPDQARLAQLLRLHLGAALDSSDSST